jgi:3-hydroxybutyryl-CoA dehydrogenase
MQLVVLGSAEHRKEWSEHQIIEWASTFADFIATKADVYIDLLFEFNPERIDALKQLAPKTVIVNSNLFTLKELNAPFIRINGWPGFLKGSVEAYAEGEQKQKADAIFNLMGLKTEWLPDQIGFITPRVVSMIINEAYFALAEGVSTKEEIDTAMKLGTAYPYGPFEWGERIGLKNIYELLQKLSVNQPRYAPADLLKESL